MQRAIDLLKLNLAKVKLHLEGAEMADPFWQAELRVTMEAYKKAITILENAQQTIIKGRTETLNL